MSEKKINNKMLASFLPVIIFVVYTVITFIIWGDNKEGGFWLGWIFSLIATIITTAIPYFMVKDGEEVKSIIDGVSVYYVTIIYFVAQLILGLLCMIINDKLMALLVILELILNAAYIFFIIASFMGKNIVSGLEKEQRSKVYFIKSIASDLSLVAGQIQDEELRKQVEKVGEIARFSDPMSDNSLSGLEVIISTKVEELKDMVSDGKMEDVPNTLRKIEEKLLERNEKCKLLK